MNEITCTILYKGEEKTYQVSMRQLGFTYRILVKLENAAVELEPDEEGQLRMIAEEQDHSRLKNTALPLLRAIMEELQEALK